MLTTARNTLLHGLEVVSIALAATVEELLAPSGSKIEVESRHQCKAGSCIHSQLTNLIFGGWSQSCLLAWDSVILSEMF